MLFLRFDSKISSTKNLLNAPLIVDMSGQNQPNENANRKPPEKKLVIKDDEEDIKAKAEKAKEELRSKNRNVPLIRDESDDITKAIKKDQKNEINNTDKNDKKGVIMNQIENRRNANKDDVNKVKDEVRKPVKANTVNVWDNFDKMKQKFEEDNIRNLIRDEIKSPKKVDIKDHMKNRIINKHKGSLEDDAQKVNNDINKAIQNKVEHKLKDDSIINATKADDLKATTSVTENVKIKKKYANLQQSIDDIGSDDAVTTKMKNIKKDDNLVNTIDNIDKKKSDKNSTSVNMKTKEDNTINNVADSTVNDNLNTIMQEDRKDEISNIVDYSKRERTLNIDDNTNNTAIGKIREETQNEKQTPLKDDNKNTIDDETRRNNIDLLISKLKEDNSSRKASKRDKRNTMEDDMTIADSERNQVKDKNNIMKEDVKKTDDGMMNRSCYYDTNQNQCVSGFQSGRLKLKEEEDGPLIIGRDEMERHPEDNDGWHCHYI